jgi:hypothetical protein
MVRSLENAPMPATLKSALARPLARLAIQGIDMTLGLDIGREIGQQQVVIAEAQQ